MCQAIAVTKLMLRDRLSQSMSQTAKQWTLFPYNNRLCKVECAISCFHSLELYSSRAEMTLSILVCICPQTMHYKLFYPGQNGITEIEKLLLFPTAQTTSVAQ